MRGIAWGKKQFSVSGRFWCSEFWSVDQTVNSSKSECADVRGPEWFFPALLLTLDEYSSWRVGRVVAMICSPVRTTLRSLLRVRFGNWAEPDSYWCAEDGFNDGWVELYQKLLWQVERPQLAKEVRPLLGLNVIVPLQVLRDGAAQESEWLFCSHSAVHDSEWGGEQGVSPEVTIISIVWACLAPGC